MNHPVHTLNYHNTLSKIVENNEKISRSNVKRILVTYDEGTFYIGDTCIMFDKFKVCKLFFGASTVVDINCLNKKYINFYQSFGLNNPHVDNVFHSPYQEIDFEEYDVVICIAYNEMELLDALHQKYYESDSIDCLKPAVFSFSEVLLFERGTFYISFPIYQALFNYARDFRSASHELFITEAERKWANGWLESEGMKAHEQLFILLDSSSSREKILRIDVYFDILLFLLGKENVKILVFDEKNVGKEEFYKEWLDEKSMKKMIFSKQRKFREDLCLIGSDYTKLVMGPCTGLLHCASGIYNNYLKDGMSPAEVPLLITYTGKWDAQAWWGNAPLINCLLLRSVNNKKQLSVLSELRPEEKGFWDNRLGCNEYTSEALIGFINARM